MPKRPPVPHHSAPCQHPTASGLPCPHRAVDHHHEYGPICALHAHHNDNSQGLTSTILVRLHPDEHKAVGVVAGTLGISMSELARHTLTGLPMPEAPRPKIDAQAYAELGRIGGNLNQIARAMNTALVAGVEPLQEAQGLVAQLNELRDLLKEVRLGLVGAP